MSTGRRILFLDDDTERASEFLATNPNAVWVETVDDCVTALREPWDEVHLDHDLGGERFVEHDRDDCGMAVVRWLCDQPRPHLHDTRFIIHSHNPGASLAMAFQLQSTGYMVEERRFGESTDNPGGAEDGLKSTISRLLSRLLGR